MKKAKQKVKILPTPEVVSYSIKMVIPTGNYANIQPEIVVKANSLDEAHDYIASHMNKLWKEYYLCNERRPEVRLEAAPPEVKETGKTESPPPITTPKETPSPVSSVALTKATQAVTSCLSKEALEIIKKQIGISVKLTEEDKKSLVGLVAEKEIELNGR